MRRPTHRMTPNTVHIERVNFWGKDSGGGRQPFRGAAGPAVACAVQPSSAEDVPPHMREEEVVYHTVKFYDNPQLQVRDRLYFGTRVLTVTGTQATSGGAGRTYIVHAEERKAGSPRL